LIGVGAGILALVIASRIPYRFYRKIALPLFALTIGLLIAVPIIGDTRGGATRWIELGPVSFQPSELAKLSTVFVLAFLLERKHKLLARFSHLIVPLGVTVGMVGVLVMRQPDLGTMIIIGAAAMAVVVASDTPFRWIGLLIVAAVLVTTYLAF